LRCIYALCNSKYAKQCPQNSRKNAKLPAVAVTPSTTQFHKKRTELIFMPFPSKSLFLGLSLIGMLSACGGPSGSNEPQKNSPLLSELNIRDIGLRTCVLKTAGQNNWTKVDQVTSLNCEFLNKTRIRITGLMINSQPLPTEDVWQPIYDTHELSAFTSLKELSLRGHLYTKIDVSELKQLEKLDLSNAFIQDIDLRNNKKLVSLNLTATGLDKLDLSGLKDLKELYIDYQGTGSDFGPYLESILKDGAKIYSFDLARFQTPKIQIILDPAVKLKTVETSQTTNIDIANNQQLESMRGIAPSSIFKNAVNLQKFSGQIVGTGILDLSQAPRLSTISVGKSFDEVIIHDNLNELSITGAVKKLSCGKSTQLKSLTIYGEIDTPINIGENQIELSDCTSLESLELNNLKIDESLDLTYNSKLKGLNIVPSNFVDLKIPPSVTSLTVTSIKNVFPLEHITNLQIDDCLLENTSLPNLKGLYLSNCSAAKFEVSQFPKLTSLDIHNSTLDTLDFSSPPDLQRLMIEGSSLNHIDWTPLIPNKNREGFYFYFNKIPLSAEIERQINEVFAQIVWLN
jgi:hypothetical protein